LIDFDGVDFTKLEDDSELLEKAKQINQKLAEYEAIDPGLLMSNYLYSVPEEIAAEEQSAYNVDIALYAYQRALYESGRLCDLRAANHHYEYYHIRRRSQTDESDVSYQALRAFALQQSQIHPEILYHISKRTKSISSHIIKYCVNVMRGFHDGGTDNDIETQVERIHDDKACRLILDMPRVSAELCSPPTLIRAVFDAANDMPDFMRRCRMKPMVANSLLDTDENHNHMLTPEVRVFYKNYVENPKPNGYHSLHTCYESLRDKEQVEYQIRTFDWHFYAEYGPATHKGYKASRLSRVIRSLQLDMLDEYEYRYAFVQFLDIVNLDTTQIMVPNFYSNGINTLDKAGIVIPITTAEEVFCTKANHKSFPLK
jgi:hypothetical protein